MYRVYNEFGYLDAEYSHLTVNICKLHNFKIAIFNGTERPSDEDVANGVSAMRRAFYKEVSDPKRNEWEFERETGNPNHETLKNEWISLVNEIKRLIPIK